MKYYKLMYDFEHDVEYAGCRKNERVQDEYIVSNGTWLSEWEDKLVLEYDPREGDKLTDYLANVYGWLIVSARFRLLIEPVVGDAIQYLDVKIKNLENGEIKKDYRIANVIDVVEGLDLTSSTYDEYELDGQKLIFVEKYSLRNSKVKGHHIFKLKGDTIPTFVSEEVKNIVENNDLMGFDFLEVNLSDNCAN